MALTEETWTYPSSDGEPYDPNPKQALAHRLWASERLYGGAAGGGKTEWLLAEVISTCLRWDVNGLVLRRTYGQLGQAEGVIPRLLERIPRTVGAYNVQEHYWTLRNGSMVQLGYLATNTDAERYVGGEYGIIAWDQLEHFTLWQYRRLFHPLRAPAAEARGYRPAMIASANPGGIGHEWVKARWIDPAPPNVVWQPNPSEEEPTPGTRCFIPARVEDNPRMGEAYHRRLENMEPDLREALRWGNWDVYLGSRFGKLWRRNVHVIDPEEWPVPIGAGIPRGRAIDYGTEDPFCCLWGAVFPDGMVVIYREVYGAGYTATEQAQLIRAAQHPEEERPGRPMPTVADPACWIRGPDDARPPAGAIAHPDAPAPGSVAGIYRRHGIAARKALNDRRAGTGLIADKLKVRRDKRPRLLVYSTCLNLIRTLPGLPRDPHDPELYATKDVEDHAADTLRYLLMDLEGTPPLPDTSQPHPRRPPRGPEEERRETSETGHLGRQGF